MYDTAFYEDRRQLTLASSARVLSVLWDVLKPRSAIDLGCGSGSWLRACLDSGVEEVLGVDGPWVLEQRLDIPQECFVAHDLSVTPYEQEARWDLAISIEVAEHLSESAGRALVNSLVRASDVVLFSAAVPGQGGLGHINEQRQSYWARVFAEHRYLPFDVIRPALWSDSRVNVVHRQNLLLFMPAAKAEELFGRGGLPISSEFDLDRVHPELLKLVAGSPPRSRLAGVLRGLSMAWKSVIGRP